MDDRPVVEDDHFGEVHRLERTFDSRYGPGMAIARRKPDPDGITRAELAGTVGRYVSQRPLDVEAAVTELREIANGPRRPAGRTGRDHPRLLRPRKPERVGA
jgi:hypothetical protein